MKQPTNPVISKHNLNQPALRTYVIGFGLSICLTLIAYSLVAGNLASRSLLLAAVACLALMQFIVQLACFFHLRDETKPKWRLLVFYFMAGIVIILVAGTLWIMSNLNYHTMSPDEVNTYLHNHESL